MLLRHRQPVQRCQGDMGIFFPLRNSRIGALQARRQGNYIPVFQENALPIRGCCVVRSYSTRAPTTAGVSRFLVPGKERNAPQVKVPWPVRWWKKTGRYILFFGGVAGIMGGAALVIAAPYMQMQKDMAERQARIAARKKHTHAGEGVEVGREEVGEGEAEGEGKDVGRVPAGEEGDVWEVHGQQAARVLSTLALLPYTQPDWQEDALRYLCKASSTPRGLVEIEGSGGVGVLLGLSARVLNLPHRSLLMELLAGLATLPGAQQKIVRSADPVVMTGLARTKGVPLELFKTELATATHFKEESGKRDSSNQLALEREDLRRLRLLQVALIPADHCMEHIVDQTKKRLSVARAVKRKEKEGRFQVGDDMFGVVASASPSPDAMLHGTCLRSLALLSSVVENRQKIVDAGGLAVLMDAHRFPPHDISAEDRQANKIEIARTLANLASDEGLLSPILSSGWLYVLTEWGHCGDINLESEAARALANLETMALARHMRIMAKANQAETPFQYILKKARRGMPHVVTSLESQIQRLGYHSPLAPSVPQDPTPVYKDGVYLLYPTQRGGGCEHWTHGAPKVDIVFVHGLLGGAFFTWRQADDPAEPNRPYEKSWPRAWLPDSIPESRVLSVEYDTGVTDWAAICPAVPATIRKRTLKIRGQMLLEKLTAAGIGERPVVFVTHSMGGLLVKSMLVEAAKRGSTRSRQMLAQTRGIVFLATPHRGSFLADYFLGEGIVKRVILPSVEVNELKENSPKLERLNRQFSKLTDTIRCLSFGETLPIKVSWAFSTLVVPRHSANPGYGEYEEYTFDHMDICKPMSRVDPRYVRMVEFIRSLLPEQQTYPAGSDPNKAGGGGGENRDGELEEEWDGAVLNIKSWLLARTPLGKLQGQLDSYRHLTRHYSELLHEARQQHALKSVKTPDENGNLDDSNGKSGSEKGRGGGGDDGVAVDGNEEGGSSKVVGDENLVK